MAQADVNANISVVTTEVASAIIKSAYEIDKAPIMLWGPPGIGKTAIVYQAAKMLSEAYSEEFKVVDFRLVTTEPVDLRGMPYIVRNAEGEPQAMAWVPAGLLPTEGRGILFLDELPQAPTINMNAAAELVYDRRLGNDYTLPEGWMVMAAGNRRSDRAGTIEMPTHMKNRLMHLEVKADVECWAKWARRSGVHESLVLFLESNTKLFHAADKADVSPAFPTPRSWERVSNVLKDAPGVKEVRRAMIAGHVGKGAMMELETYLDRGKGLPRYEDIVADPKNAPEGNSEGEAYGILSMIAAKAQTKDLDAIVTYFRRHRRELVRTAVHTMITREKSFVQHKAFHDYAKSFGEAQ